MEYDIVYQMLAHRQNLTQEIENMQMRAMNLVYQLKNLQTTDWHSMLK
jgi:hypothetical protein